MFAFNKATIYGLATALVMVMATATSIAATPQSDTASYVGMWKGTTYGGNGTFADITLTLNANGSYSCSGYPPIGDPKMIASIWTPWVVICVTPDDQTNKWEVILPSVIRFTHNNFDIKDSPMSLVSISELTDKKLVLDLPGGSSSFTFAEFTKQ